MSQPSFPGHLKREDPAPSERQRAVFAALVTFHGASQRPVGSEVLGAAAGLRLSAASIRSELAELEGLGLLERPHASAGRVPTARGYEYFVRHFVSPTLLPAEVLDQVDATLSRSVRDVERLLDEASRLLASLTQQLGLALADSLERERLTRLDLVPLEDTRAMMVLNVGSAHVRTLVLELDSPMSAGDLAEVAGVLRSRLLDCTLAEERDRLDHDPELVRDSAVRLVARAARERWHEPLSTPLLSAGRAHIARQPEFASSAALGSVLRAVESGHPLGRLMISTIEGQAAARVGVDEDDALLGCSLVSFALPGPVPGAVGVLGPLRMNYALALAAVDAVGSRVADLLQS
jgi:heat-inducible transcriptional repressor